jgi:hypothetical protein
MLICCLGPSTMDGDKNAEIRELSSTRVNLEIPAYFSPGLKTVVRSIPAQEVIPRLTEA